MTMSFSEYRRRSRSMVCLPGLGFPQPSTSPSAPGRLYRALGLFFSVLFLASAPVWQAHAAEGTKAPPLPQRHVLPGPIEAEVIRVQDGDTLLVRARVWVGQDIVVHARIAGIDTPELRGRCARERRLALRARDFVVARVSSGLVRLLDIRYGKYAGRVVTGIRTDDGTDLGQALLAAGLARPYDGRRRGGWCPQTATGE